MPHPIRLLQIVDSLHPGGMENIMVQVCNALDPAKFEVTVCCLGDSGPFAQRLSPRVRLTSLRKQPGFQWGTVHELRKLVRAGCDLVHTHHLGGLIYASLARGMRCNPKIVHSEHIMWGQADLNWKRQWQRKLLYRLCSCVFTVSRQQLDQMKALGHRHSWQTTLINGVDPIRFHPSERPKAAIQNDLGLDPSGFWLGKVARFGETKRHRDLIHAFELAVIKEPRLRLLLVGDGGVEKQSVLQQIQSSPVRDLIHWAGFQQDPVPWYQAMNVLVVASSFEGMPNAVLEGMACGLPLLANDVCGIRELARDGEHGWIEDLSTVEHLAESMLKVAQASPEKLATMGAAAGLHVRDHFSVESMLEKYDRLYTAVSEGETVIF